MPTPGKRFTLLEFKQAVESVQPGKIDLSEFTEYKNAHTRGTCICKICGCKWQATPFHIMNKKPTGCPACAGKGKKQDDFIRLSKEKYGVGAFLYDLVIYLNMRDPVILMCKYGHQFKTSPGVHLREDSCGGCKECQAHATSLRNSYSEEQWIELALSKHDNYYSYARTIYKGSGIKVIITCPHHGDFEQDPISHLSGCGCPVCGIKRSATAKILSEQDERDIFAKSHQLHANRYEYLRLFRVEGRLYIEMICPRHDIISQRLDHHIHGHGCMQCTPQYSKLQMEILKYYAVSRYPSMLHAENGGEYKIPGTRYKADGFHSETNTVVEIHGDFWHGGDEYNPLEVNPRTGTTYGSLREKTKRKEEEIKKLGHNLISIWGTEWFRGQQAITILQKLWRKKALTPAPAAPPGTP